jgi:lipoprotein-releasing system ATP-binding protein
MSQHAPQSVVLEAKNLFKSFYKPAEVSILKGVSLQVHKGESVAILGRSGQGKSTLLQILGTLESPCQGVIEVLGQPVNSINKSTIRNKHLSFVFQSFHLMEDYTALENVLMPARIARRNVTKGGEAYIRGLELLHIVGLADRAHFHTKLLSGGEKQRVAIARALCNDPDIILGDEPSGNLDKQTSRAIHDLLLGFANDHGKTLLLVTHDQDLASLCTKRYTLHEGILS